MPGIQERISTAEIAAEQIEYHRSAGMTPRESAQAIGWTVPPGAEWGMVAALYTDESAKLLDRRGKRVCADTTKAGSANCRLAAIGLDPVVSLAGAAAFDVFTQHAKDRSRMPISQAPLLEWGAIDGHAANGSTRSEWRSV
jgi:hypothetical protein